MFSSTTPQISIRPASAEDRATIARLAALDSAPVPFGAALVAQVDGEVLAALPLAGGRLIADPFRRTAEIAELLELRARQVPAAEPASGSTARPLLGRLLGHGDRRSAVPAAH
jgi:hypothetical protein